MSGRPAQSTKPEISDALKARLAEISGENLKYRVPPARRSTNSLSKDKLNEKEGMDSPNQGASKPPKRVSRRPLPLALAGRVLGKVTSPSSVALPHVPLIHGKPSEPMRASSLTAPKGTPEAISEILFLESPDEAQTIKINRFRKSFNEDDTLPRHSQDITNNHEELRSKAKISNVTNEKSLNSPPKERLFPSTKAKVEHEEKLNSRNFDTKEDAELRKKLAILQTTLSSTEERFEDAKKRFEKEIESLKTSYESKLLNNQSNSDILTSLKSDLEKSKNTISELQVELNSTITLHKHEEAIARLKEDLVDLKDKLFMKEKENSALVDEAKLNQTKMEQQEQELEDLKAREESHLSEKVELTKEIEDLKSKLEIDVENTEMQLAELSEFKKIVQELEKENDNLAADNDDLLVEIDKLKKTVESLTLKSEQLETSTLKLQDLIASRDEDKARLENALHKMESKYESLSGKTASKEQELSNNIESLMRINEVIQRENDVLREKLHNLSSQEKRESFKTLEKENVRLEQELKYWEQCHAQIQKEVALLEQEKRELVTQMKSDQPYHEPEITYLSNDEDVMNFIQQMTEKTNKLKSEIAHLKSENEMLRLKKGSMDSAYLSDSPKSKFKDLSYEEEYNSLLNQYNMISLELSAIEAERDELDSRLTEIQSDYSKVRRELDNEKARNLGGIREVDGEPPSLSTMRKEFRKAIEEVRRECQESLKKEINERFQAQKTIRAIKREKDTILLSKVNRSIQT